MTMRVDCKYYESRTYASGDAVRMCRLDLAPEAPWRCPVDCPKYTRRIADGGWVLGSLVSPPVSDEPPSLDDDAVRLLDNAEDILNAAGPEIIAEVQAQRAASHQRRRWWWPFGSS